MDVNGVDHVAAAVCRKSLLASTGTVPATGAERAQVPADGAPAAAAAVAVETVPEFSATQLKDPAARWVVIIQVSSDISAVNG